MRPLYGHADLVCKWVALQIPHVRRTMTGPIAEQPFGPANAIGVVDRDGQLVAGVVYHNYMPWNRSIELSFAATTHRWLTRDLIGVFLNYPFNELNCNRLTGVTPRKATSARRFLDKFGFKHEGCVRRGFGDDDAIISGLLKHEWERSKWALSRPERLKLRDTGPHGKEDYDRRAA